MTTFDRSTNHMLNPLPNEPLLDGPELAASFTASETIAPPDNEIFETYNHSIKSATSTFAVLTCGNCGYKLAAGSPYCPQCQVQFSTAIPQRVPMATTSASAMQSQEQTPSRGSGKYLGWIIAACVVCVYCC